MTTARAALVVSVLALVGAWGGPAIARTLITGDDIARNSVTGRNVAGLSGRDVVRDGIDGSDIDEQSLETVPRARRAGGADRVNGVDIDRFHYADPTGARRTFLDRAGLVVSGFCNDGQLEVRATTSTPDTLVRVAVTTPTRPTQVIADNNFDPGDEVDLLAGLDGAVGTLIYTVPNGPTATVTYLGQDLLPAGTGHQCVLGGTAVFSRP